MTEKEQSSLGKQLAHCHSINRKMKKPFNFLVTSVTGILFFYEEPRLATLAEKYQADKWGITLKEENLLELFPAKKVVYLTGDAE